MDCYMSGLKYHYDEDADILYVSRESLKGSVGDEDDDGVVLFTNVATKAVTGVTIFNYGKRCRQNLIQALSLPPEIPAEKIMLFQP